MHSNKTYLRHLSADRGSRQVKLVETFNYMILKLFHLVIYLAIL